MSWPTPCLSPLDFWNIECHSIFFQFQTKKKKSISKQTRFFVKFELDFYCLCSLQKSISKSNWFFNFLNSIFRNWKKIEWHSIFQKSSGDRQGDTIFVIPKISHDIYFLEIWNGPCFKQNGQTRRVTCRVLSQMFSWYEIVSVLEFLLLKSRC